MASIRQDKYGTWYLRWSASGKGKEKSLGKITEREAKAKKKAKEVELDTGQKIILHDRRFADFCGEYKEWYIDALPASAYRVNQIITQHLQTHFDTLPLSKISIREADQYRGLRSKQGASAATIRKELQTLHAMLERAVAWGELQKHNLAGLTYPKAMYSKAPRYYTVEELHSIYKADPTYWHWWKLLANTGIRRTEMKQIKISQIDFLRRTMAIESTDTERTKSGKWRELPLNQAALEALSHFDLSTEYLFPRYNVRSYSRAFSRAVKTAKLTGSIHCLRHTFCSHLVMNGTNLRTVKELAGHSRIEVTERYSHLAPSHLASATTVIAL